MSDKPLYTGTATLDPTASIAQTNKVLSNTYWLLGLTLAFSALSATISVAVGVPPMAGLVLMFVGFNSSSESSRLFLLNGTDMTELGSADMGARLAANFHGKWMPDGKDYAIGL